MDTITSYLVDCIGQQTWLPVHAIYLYGSKVESGQVDNWSDTDLIIVLTAGTTLAVADTIAMANDFGPVMGREVQVAPDQLTMRYVVVMADQVELIDLSVYTYSGWQTRSNKPDTIRLWQRATQGVGPEAKNEQQAITQGDGEILKNWFLYFLCVKKMARQDYLIGWHLLLDLVRTNLVLAMEQRDQALGTTVHRFGQGELPEVLTAFADLDPRHNQDVKSYLLRNATWYAQHTSQLDERTWDRYRSLEVHLARWV